MAMGVFVFVEVALVEVPMMVANELRVAVVSDAVDVREGPRA